MCKSTGVGGALLKRARTTFPGSDVRGAAAINDLTKAANVHLPQRALGRLQV
jgi:hypothetical protein